MTNDRQSAAENVPIRRVAALPATTPYTMAMLNEMRMMRRNGKRSKRSRRDEAAGVVIVQEGGWGRVLPSPNESSN
jgi:hypothetical protein